MDLHLARVEKRLPFPRKVLELAFLVAEEAYIVNSIARIALITQTLIHC